MQQGDDDHTIQEPEEHVTVSKEDLSDGSVAVKAVLRPFNIAKGHVNDPHSALSIAAGEFADLEAGMKDSIDLRVKRDYDSNAKVGVKGGGDGSAIVDAAAELRYSPTNAADPTSV